jgi:hypothetical protein
MMKKIKIMLNKIIKIIKIKKKMKIIFQKLKILRILLRNFTKKKLRREA